MLNLPGLTLISTPEKLGRRYVVHIDHVLVPPNISLFLLLFLPLSLQLAASLLSRLDPTYQEPSATSDPALLPTYTQPKAVYTVLPGLPPSLSHPSLTPYLPSQVDSTISMSISHTPQTLQTHSRTRPARCVVAPQLVSSCSLCPQLVSINPHCFSSLKFSKVYPHNYCVLYFL